MVRGDGAEGGTGDEEEGWLQTGGSTEKEQAKRLGEVRTLDASGNIGGDATEDEEDEIPDMEDEEDDDAIIRDTSAGTGKT
jgi:ubiquitin-like-conjugating enzyme ATG3